MALITQIKKAVISGDIMQPFTVQDLKIWMLEKDIRKNDGEYYAEASVNSILSNSDLLNKPTSNLNAKILISTKFLMLRKNTGLIFEL
ncbi:hypothetical protein [Limnohabitans sp. G3-2]|uniref:hypothetical protein n=1 Tax=Limnohabitans sp. G3-2 TaxID=1100711 RepID=UPI000C1F3044|nr:hypothetical protein [Limnohabitans sp. G3-2]PIT71760.1 hypothetical protein B9Z31_14300 [Limnohabitans sp. G3-2]PIT71766.1 hypothetical protein B9Z31_14330 [Limnohabitans sp. G3-2]